MLLYLPAIAVFTGLRFEDPPRTNCCLQLLMLIEALILPSWCWALRLSFCHRSSHIQGIDIYESLTAFSTDVRNNDRFGLMDTIYQWRQGVFYVLHVYMRAYFETSITVIHSGFTIAKVLIGYLSYDDVRHQDRPAFWLLDWESCITSFQPLIEKIAFNVICIFDHYL